MKIEARNYKVKSGIEIQIREAKIEDSNHLIECVKSYLQSNQIPLTIQEFELMSKGYENWIKKFIDGRDDLLLVADYNEKIIGNIDLTINPRKMLNHIGYLGMGVHLDYQNQGIGTLLLKELIEWTENNPNIEIVWLQVFGNNETGIRLYEKFGFEKTGLQPNFIKNIEGKYIDNIIMTKYKKAANR